MISNYRYQCNYTCYLHYEWHVQLYISNYDLTFYRIKACYFLFRMDSITLDYNLKEENVKKIYYMQKVFAFLKCTQIFPMNEKSLSFVGNRARGRFKF